MAAILRFLPKLPTWERVNQFQFETYGAPFLTISHIYPLSGLASFSYRSPLFMYHSMLQKLQA